MVDRPGQKKMDALCNITLTGCKWENGYPNIATSEILTHDISRLHTRITRVKHTNIKRKRNIMFPANVYHSLALERPLTQLIKALRPKWPWVHDRRLIKGRQIGDFRCHFLFSSCHWDQNCCSLLGSLNKSARGCAPDGERRFFGQKIDVQVLSKRRTIKNWSRT